MSEETIRRAIILIPGLKREEKNTRRDVLAVNLCATSARYPAEETGPIDVAGEMGLALKVTDHGNGAASVRTIDLFEAYWGDMIADQTPETPLERISQGAKLLVYWFFGGVWKAFAVSRYMTLGMILSGVLLLLWYFSVVVLAAQAISLTPDALDATPLPEPVAKAIQGWAASLGQLPNWTYWAVFAGFIGASGADRIARIALFSKAYLGNEINAQSVGLRDRVGRRVKAVLNSVYAAGYDEVIVLGYSFGSVVALDVLADHPDGVGLGKTRLVTWGSPAAVLTYRSEWLRSQCAMLIQRRALHGWDDYHAPCDWLCAPAPGHAKAGIGRSVSLHLDAFWLQGMTGKPHARYFQTQEALEDLLAPIGAAEVQPAD